MSAPSKHGWWVLWVAALLLAEVHVSGCSSITPYHPRNHREEGPERGVFTGSRGEFVVPLPSEPAPESDKAKTAPEKTPPSE
jgi:hypothetical protein